MEKVTCSNSFRLVELPLPRNLEVIPHAETHGYIDAESFGIGETTALTLSRDEEVVELDEVKEKMGSNRKRRFRKTEIFSINVRTWKWLMEVMERGEPISEKIIKQKALSFAHDEGVLNFSASNGWLAALKKRHGFRLIRTSSGSYVQVNSKNVLSGIKENVYTSTTDTCLKIDKEQSPEESPETRVEKQEINCRPKSRWIRLFPETYREEPVRKKKKQELKPASAYNPLDLSYLLDPGYSI